MLDIDGEFVEYQEVVNKNNNRSSEELAVP